MSLHLNRAFMLLQQGRHSMAEQELRRILGETPNDPIAHATLALCLAEMGKYEEASQEAGTAIELAPEHPYGFYAQAVVFQKRNRFDEAEVAIRHAIDLNPEDPDFYAHLGQIHLNQSKWEAALQAADEGLKIDPEHVDCTNIKARALVKTNRKADAQAAIEGALARDPENSWSHANLGWTLLDEGKYQKAMEHFREALRLEPNNEWARMGIVEALKAKRILYRPMLWYFLWISKFSGRGQWMIILGAFFGVRILRSLADQNPSLAPWVTPIVVVYAVFALSTWIASPLFNLMLFLDPFGRMALSREEKITASIVGLCVLGSLLCLGSVALGVGSSGLLAAAAFALLIPPVSRIYHCEEGAPRITMVVISSGLAALGLIGMAGLFLGDPEGSDGQKVLATLGGLALLGFLVGAIASQFLANVLAGWRSKK